MMELLTGHCRPNGHLRIMKAVNDPLCRSCNNEEETTLHALCSSEVYAKYRFKHLGRHMIQLGEIQDMPIKCLLNFISATVLFKD